MKFYAPLVLALLIAGCSPERGANVDFKASPLKPGGDVTFSKEYAGKPALIYIWATWCGPCRMVAPKIEDLKKEYESKGIAFIALAQDGMAAVRKFEAATPHDLDVIADTTGTITRSVDVSAIPVIVVVDSDHNTVAYEQGVPTDDYAAIRAALNAVAKK
ncbi:MAG: TlpA disulfide reductase family protein [Armatimonadota bacterium]